MARKCPNLEFLLQSLWHEGVSIFHLNDTFRSQEHKPAHKTLSTTRCHHSEMSGTSRYQSVVCDVVPQQSTLLLRFMKYSDRAPSRDRLVTDRPVQIIMCDCSLGSVRRHFDLDLSKELASMAILTLTNRSEGARNETVLKVLTWREILTLSDSEIELAGVVGGKPSAMVAMRGVTDAHRPW